jgi:hypothetical protein
LPCQCPRRKASGIRSGCRSSGISNGIGRPSVSALALEELVDDVPGEPGHGQADGDEQTHVEDLHEPAV